MAIQVKDLIADVYVLAGNVTRDMLPIEIVLKYTSAELNRRAIELGINEQNYFLKSQEKPLLNERDQLVSIADFGTPVAVHFVDPFTGIEQPVSMVNFNTLLNWEADGQLRCSIYGKPPHIRFSLMLNQFSGWIIKFWYEPDTEASKSLTANVDVLANQQFRELLTFNITQMCMPYVETAMDRKAGIVEMLADRIGNIELDGTLENLWHKVINPAKQYAANTRRPFRAGASRTTRYSRGQF